MKKHDQPWIPSRRARDLGMILSALFCMLPFFFGLRVRAQSKENIELQSVYRQMEAAGKNLRSFSAKIVQKKYTAILKEFGTPEKGDFYLARAKDGSTMMRRDISSPGRSILTLKGDLAIVYQPAMNQALTTNLGKNADKAAEFLAFGIGKPPADLQKNYDISYHGDEAVAGVPCSVLTMKPQNLSMAKWYPLIFMWVKKSSGIPIQYKLQEPNNDYLLVTFSDEKLNVRIPESMFEQKLPKNVERLRY
jgi:outer membrane lipoprotein-sorting protein